MSEIMLSISLGIGGILLLIIYLDNLDIKELEYKNKNLEYKNKELERN